LSAAKEAIEKDKSLSPSMKAIFNLLTQMNLELLTTVQELNKKLNLTSKNSSKPPSSDRFPKGDSKKSGKGKRKPGGQKGRKGSTLRKVENPNEVKDHKPKGKCKCGTSVSALESTGYVSRQVWNLLIKTIITEHRVHKVTCSCGQQHKGSFPRGVINNTQYGDSIKAIASYLSQYQLIPPERTQEMFKDVFNLEISPGTVCNTNTFFYNKLEGFEAEVKETLFRSKINHSDETGINIAGKNKWLHVLSNEYYTYLHASEKRGQEGMNEMEILPQYKGVLIHDFFRAYFKYDCTHVFCGSHLIRELLFSEEQDKKRWARKMRQLLQISNKLRNKRRLSDSWVDKIESWYSRILLMGNKESPPPKVNEVKRKGKISLFGRKKKTKSRCLLERLRDYRKGVLMFLYDSLIPFTNNLAERDLRMAKVHQKISGCFRSISGARVYARIRSYISTLKKQKINVMDGIVDALSGSDLTLKQLFG
jgi:transposase